MNDSSSPEPNKDGIPPSEREALASLIHALSDTKKADDEQSRAQTRAAKWTAGATVAIAAFTFATIGVGVAQWWVLSRTVTEMRDEQRPWIRIDSVDVKNVHINGNNLSASAVYDITNVGHRPAVAIFAVTEILDVALPKKLLIENPAMNLCSWSDAGGLATVEIKKFSNSISAISFPEGKDIVTGSINGKFDGIFRTGAWDTQFILVSCMSYYEPHSLTIRHTAISTMVTIHGPIKDGDIADTQIKISRPDFGWFNYAD